MEPGPSGSRTLDLRAGDLVEVRGREEILATLDRDARLDALPFMPEMFQYCGKRYRVFKRADKTCDTINGTGTRRLFDTVHLEGLRCDGTSHGGCQALCLLFWKEAWLRRAPSFPDESPSRTAPSEVQPPPPSSLLPPERCTEEAVVAATRVHDGLGASSRERFSCQATELLLATSPLAWWDVRQYARDVRSGNVRFGDLARGVALGVFNTIQRRRGGTTRPYLKGTLTRTPAARLDLRPGEMVRVKPLAEIRETLDRRRRNRGLKFDMEMVRYCGRTFRVLARVEQIIDDRTGEMISLPNDCIILEGATCLGNMSVTPNRLFCPRSIYPFWREIWLERVE